MLVLVNGNTSGGEINSCFYSFRNFDNYSNFTSYLNVKVDSTFCSYSCNKSWSFRAFLFSSSFCLISLYFRKGKMTTNLQPPQMEWKRKARKVKRISITWRRKLRWWVHVHLIWTVSLLRDGTWTLCYDCVSNLQNSPYIKRTGSK